MKSIILRKMGGVGLKRYAAALCAVFFIMLALFHTHASAESSASKIDLYCTVNSDGDCLVSMTVNLKLEAADAGLEFPLPENAEKITMNGSSVPTSRVGSRTLVSVGRITGGMTGEFPVRFDYTIPKAVGAVPATLSSAVGSALQLNKLQLTLPMLCGFDYPVDLFSFVITMPDTVDGVPTFTSTYQQVGFASNLDLVINGNMITGTSINTLNDHESVTMTLLVPREMFPSVSTYQRTGNPELIPMGIFLGAALLYWLLFLRTLPPVRQRTTVPPEGICAGELGCRVTMTGGDLTMMVLSWAQVGYLMIQPNGSRVILRKQMEMGNERSLFEIRVFQTLFNNRNVVNCSSPGYAKMCKKTAGMIPGEKAMCRPRSGSRKVFRWLLCGSQVFCGVCVAMNMTSITVLQILFSLIFGVLGAVSAWELHEFAMHLYSRKRLHCWIGLGVIAFWFLLGLIAGQPWIPLGSCAIQLLMGFPAAFGGMRTELNRSEAGEILSVRRFLKSIPRPEAARLLKSDPEYFYRMAPYAIALGVGKPFAACFGRRPLEPCPYLVTRNGENRTAAEWMRLLTQTVDLMDSRYHRMQTERWMAIRFR